MNTKEKKKRIVTKRKRVLPFGMSQQKQQYQPYIFHIITDRIHNVKMVNIKMMAKSSEHFF